MGADTTPVTTPANPKLAVGRRIARDPAQTNDDDVGSANRYCYCEAPAPA
jgi:hypothetical protein